MTGPSLVDALEPAAQSARACGASLGDEAAIACATYEQLSAAVLDGEGNAASALGGSSYDAVLLGRTSLMHVAQEAERARLFAALDRICPRGPLLLTFHPSDHARARSAAFGMGRRLGVQLARVRSAEVSAADEELRFGVACGFLRGLASTEIESHAHASRRRAVWDGEDEGTVRAHLRSTR